MGFWNSLCGWFGLYGNDTSSSATGCEIINGVVDLHENMGGTINPANGLPMAGAVDVQGNPYGCDFHHNDDWVNTHTWDD